jgi:hypothetical protein
MAAPLAAGILREERFPLRESAEVPHGKVIRDVYRTRRGSRYRRQRRSGATRNEAGDRDA